MPNLIKIDTGEYPVSVQEFRQRFKNTSFPVQIPFSEFGYAVVFDVPQPTHTRLQRARELPPEISKKGAWQQVWIVVDLEKEMKPEDYTLFLASLAEQDAKDDSVKAEAKLKDIDLKSIRSIREWVAKQPDAPEYLKSYEIEAIAERAKLEK